MKAKKVNMTQKTRNAYRRVIEMVPAPFRYEQSVQQLILKYLDSKGEQFVIQKVKRALDDYSKSHTGSTAAIVSNDQRKDNDRLDRNNE